MIRFSVTDLRSSVYVWPPNNILAFELFLFVFLYLSGRKPRKGLYVPFLCDQHAICVLVVPSDKARLILEFNFLRRSASHTKYSTTQCR